jgi:hypothetical protein
MTRHQSGKELNGGATSGKARPMSQGMTGMTRAISINARGK